MQNIQSMADLNRAIHLLENEQVMNGQLLKEQFRQTYESLKPVNLLRNAFKDISSSPFLIDNLIDATIGLTTGYLSKIVFVGKSVNYFRKFIGYVLQFGVSNLVAHNTEEIKKMVQLMFQQFFHKKKTNS